MQEKIEKIKKLLSLAESGGAEGGLAFQRAAEMILKYQLDEALLKSNRGDLPGRENIPVPKRHWAQLLFQVIADGFGCQAVNVKKTNYSALFGFESDRVTARLMFEYAHKIILKKNRQSLEAKIIKKKSSLGYKMWMVLGIKSVLADLKKSSQAEQAPEYGIMVADKKRLVNDLANKAFPQITASSMIPRERGAASLGYHEGRKISFAKQVVPAVKGLLGVLCTLTVLMFLPLQSWAHGKEYCATCERGKLGHIKRDPRQTREFRKTHPCPAPGKHKKGTCPGYVIDHIVPLKRGGADRPDNMQWQTKEEAKAKDKWE